MLGNLKLLKEDMKNKGWTICTFTFRYKSINYIVLVKRFVGSVKRISEYALVKLEFMKENDLSDVLEVEANSNRLLIDAKTLREYFGIEYSDNLGDIINQFSNQLGDSIPANIKVNISDIEKQAMVRSLSVSDSEDPEKIYCTMVRRNPKGKKRSEFNSDKTKLLRGELFKFFKDDESISFCYSKEVEKENDDATILKNFSKR
ncbi:DUF6037 family protein [Pauljensenia sp. UMB1235]|uniref:DUF6037 family protein n=1 Tax=unclassified Pauljensenia TaxID=2908895 RepID=UPI00254E6F1C|nr:MULTISPECIES: DUF6037 family protein [unclassified Pauljensenia]MDK6400694.1 DUF6037 family protein [Pauljensenia sp. UMB9872]MDK7173100.1 DUF6037 family protein [Pauljensenia sp. UMB1235]